jgi:hypothetical protein
MSEHTAGEKSLAVLENSGHYSAEEQGFTHRYTKHCST